MEIFWFIVLMVMLGIYVILDGYDFGAGIVHLFLAKTEEEKKAVTNAIGPFWDANEVWLIASGGVLFFAFYTICIGFQWFLSAFDAGLMVVDFQSCGTGIAGTSTSQNVGSYLG